MPPGEAQSEHEDDQGQGDHEAGNEERIHLRSLPAAEAPIACGEGQPENDDDVRDALDEDRSHGPGRRGTVAPLEQVGPVQVAELGGDQAVDEPREEEDLGRGHEADWRARAPQDEGPAEAPQREGQVVHHQGEHQQTQVCVGDLRPRTPPVDAQDEDEKQDQQRDAKDDRADGPHVQEAASQAHFPFGNRL